MEKFLGYAKRMMKEVATQISDEVPEKREDTDRGLLVLRLALGFFFIYHGLGAFFAFYPNGGISTLALLLAGIGFPGAIFWAYLLAFIELFGGITVLLGFFTKIFGILFSVIAIVAFVTVHHFAPGVEAGGVDILALGASLCLMFAGPGSISLAERWYREDAIKPIALPKAEKEEKKEAKNETKKEKEDVKDKEKETVIEEEIVVIETEREVTPDDKEAFNFQDMYPIDTKDDQKILLEEKKQKEDEKKDKEDK